MRSKADFATLSDDPVRFRPLLPRRGRGRLVVAMQSPHHAEIGISAPPHFFRKSLAPPRLEPGQRSHAIYREIHGIKIDRAHQYLLASSRG
jgi:hypothetical protein